MPGTASTRHPRIGLWPAVYWVGALLAYAACGVFYQPFFLLGFWQSIPLLFVFTWLAGRLFGGNGPVRPDPDPAADERTDGSPPG